ncbi:MAG: cobalamin biosynthesis protein CobW [Phycisphaerae bacterium]|nr:cobalamin biosynthesis protein CobW [Phycisphaerae bacterium]
MKRAGSSRSPGPEDGDQGLEPEHVRDLHGIDFMTTEQNPTDSPDRIPVLVLNGFLGSGKTTLLRSLLVQSRRDDIDLGVIVNDMSELDVDGQIVAQTEFFEEGDRRFQSIHACVLSSRRGVEALGNALEAITSEGPPELIIIETSGSCHPMPLVEFFSTRPRYRLTGLLTLVDAAMIEQDYEGGDRIVPELQHNLRNRRRDTTNLLVEQILFSTHVLLTKADRIGDDRIRVIAEGVHDLNRFVPVLALPWGNLPLDDLRSLPEYDYHRVRPLIEELSPDFDSERGEDRPYDLATRVIKDDRPFHPQRLWETCTRHLGQHIHRSKGFFYLCTRDDVSLLWNQAAAGIDLELVGHWRAGILEDENSNLDEMEREGLRERLAKEPGRFGDRQCHLTVIGDRSQVDRFTESLMDCFLTEDEIVRWRAGETFPDPWPKEHVTRTH